MVRELDFSGREQLYYQIYDILFQDIMNGKYKVGSALPPENELTEIYQVSRSTVRKAMDMLVNDELIEKRRGHGTYVKSTRPKSSLKHVVSYSRKNSGDKEIAFKKVISLSEVKADKVAAKYLQIEEGVSLIKLKRVRYADKEPMYLEINHYEKQWVPEMINRDFSKESLRVFLSNCYNVVWAYANQEIYSILATKELADLLSIKEGEALIYIKRVSYDVDNVPREFVESYYRADNYHLEIELSI